MKLNAAQRKVDAELRKNPLVQAAAIMFLALGLEYTNDRSDADEAAVTGGKVLVRCLSLMGLPSSEGKLTPKQEDLHDAVTDAIMELSAKMGAALIKARLLRSDCAGARHNEIGLVRRKAAQSHKAAA